MKTLCDLAREYLDHLAALQYSKETRRKIRLELLSFNRFLGSVTTPAALQTLHLRKFQSHLSGSLTRKGYPLKARSLNFKIAKIKGFLQYLAKNGHIQAHLVEAVVHVKEPRLLPGNTLNHSQTKQLLGRIATATPLGHRNRTMLELLYTSGIRAGELLFLNVTDIDFDHQTALINGKGQKQRVVPIGRTAMGYLSAYVKAVRPYLVKAPSEQALFVSQKGTRLDYSTFRRMIKAVAGTMDPLITAHTFRRSCTTELIRGGANIYHVKELLGHESLATLRSYTRLTITDLKKTHKKCHPRERD